MTRAGWAAALFVLVTVGAAAPVRCAAALDRAPIDIVQLSRDEQAIPPVTLTADQAAAVLMEVAGRFEERGELNAARLLYREVVDRYGETIHAPRALERLREIEGRPDFAPPDTTAGPSGAPGSTAETGPPRSTSEPAVAVAPPARPAVRRAGLDQSGRISVIVYSTMLSSYVALAIPIYAESEGSAAYGLALLLGPPAGLVTSIYATRNRQVTAAQSDVYVLAGNMGLWHGLAIGLIEDLEGHEVAGTAAIGGAAGAVTGALLVSPGHTRETAASLASLAAPCGIWFGLITNEIFASGRPANEVDTGTSDEGDRRIGAMLLGGDAALLAAVLTERRLELSRDRARLIGLTGAAGAAVGGAIDLLFSIRDRQAWGMVGAGTAGGLVAGLALTADYDTKRGFSDPLHPESSSLSSDPGSGDPRSTDSSSRFRGAGLTATVMPLRLRALSPAGPATPRWREALKRIGVSGAPAVGLTLLEARF